MDLLKLLKTNWIRPKNNILVIGSPVSGIGVSSCAWKDSSKLNVTDYDALILDLSTLQKTEYDYRTWVDWYHLPPLDDLIRLLFSGKGEIIVVGNPHFRVRYEDRLFGEKFCSFVNWWLPVFPEYELKSGETIRGIKREFAFYFRNVKRWSFHLNLKSTHEDNSGMKNLESNVGLDRRKEGNLYAGSFGKIINKPLTVIEGKLTPLACTRLSDPIGFKIRFAGKDETHTRKKFPDVRSCEVIFLPEPTEINSSEAIKLILKNRYGSLLSDYATQKKARPVQEPIVEKAPDTIGSSPPRVENPPTFDIFISHASEDKESIARPLYHELTAKGLSVWFDEATLELGDSLRRKIDDGLAHCRFGVVILSPQFLAKEWPQRELDGLLARETTSGQKAILPVWHDLDAAIVTKHSPTLAGRLAVRSSDGISVIAEKILRVLKK